MDQGLHPHLQIGSVFVSLDHRHVDVLGQLLPPQPPVSTQKPAHSSRAAKERTAMPFMRACVLMSGPFFGDLILSFLVGKQASRVASNKGVTVYSRTATSLPLKLKTLVVELRRTATCLCSTACLRGVVPRV
jgi:hypothetical protein